MATRGSQPKAAAPVVLPTPPWLQAQLERLLAQKGHALLLTGPSGLGQFDLALSLARAWLCERPVPSGACGECESCHAVDVHTHPDMRVLLPDVMALAHGWPIDPKTQDKIDKKELKPSKFIRVEATREAVAFTQLTRSRSATKVVLVYPAERMNHESANTLLKTLEEPTGEVRFVLATEASHQLLPTIRSRCQSHAMSWPKAEEATSWLLDAARALDIKGANETEAHSWLKAAGGRPNDALALAESGLTSAAWAGIPGALAKGDWSDLADWPAARQLDVMQKLCHDLLACASGAEPRFFDARSLPAAGRLPVLAAWARDLSQQARSVEHPYNAQLMQEAWAARAKDVLSR
ncbi:DNA polymerase III subunit delta' [Hydrogenophaga sp. 5NK40-0174]|uniref:DNA polymerase III subunit delta' n=1 Tax=Hydrogenophaga sp. 5NK40-0174 TaxID=3127649 RepID=UPI00310ACE27